jgi:hypothetical protein
LKLFFIENSSFDTYHIEIYNIHGNKIIEGSEKENCIDILTFAPGVYQVIFINDEGLVQSDKLIVE